MKCKVLRLLRANLEVKNVSFTPSVMWAEVVQDVPGKGQVRRFYNAEGIAVAEVE